MINSIDDVIAALACSDDFDLGQESIAVRTREMLRDWRAGRLTHDGDCTNVAHTCQLCLCENYEKRALAFIAERAKTRTPPEGGAEGATNSGRRLPALPIDLIEC